MMSNASKQEATPTAHGLPHMQQRGCHVVPYSSLASIDHDLQYMHWLLQYIAYHTQPLRHLRLACARLHVHMYPMDIQYENNRSSATQCYVFKGDDEYIDTINAYVQ